MNKELEHTLASRLGPKPSSYGSIRRWTMLRRLAVHIHDHNPTTFDELVIWSASHLECLNVRTLRENYVDYLETIGLIEIDKEREIIFKGPRETKKTEAKDEEASTT